MVAVAVAGEGAATSSSMVLTTGAEGGADDGRAAVELMKAAKGSSSSISGAEPTEAGETVPNASNGSSPCPGGGEEVGTVAKAAKASSWVGVGLRKSTSGSTGFCCSRVIRSADLGSAARLREAAFLAFGFSSNHASKSCSVFLGAEGLLLAGDVDLAGREEVEAGGGGEL